MAAIHLVIESMSPADTSTSIHTQREKWDTEAKAVNNNSNMRTDSRHRYIYTLDDCVCVCIYFDEIHVNLCTEKWSRKEGVSHWLEEFFMGIWTGGGGL